MVVGDIYDIENRLQEIDRDITLNFDIYSKQYEVYHKGYFVMSWSRPLDVRLIEHMRKIDVRRGYDPLKEIDEHNENLEKIIEKDRLNHIESVVKYYQPKLRNEIDGTNTKTVY